LRYAHRSHEDGNRTEVQVLRVPTEKEYCHERLGEEFRTALSEYDTQRRIEILVDRFLGRDRLEGRSVLEVGAGFGFFSDRLQRLGGLVTATDIGVQLLEEIRRKIGCRSECVDALSLIEHFGSECFDVVLSSECIEHTPNPMEAVAQMAGVLKPGGYLALSTPNVLWSPVVRIATLAKVRPFDGLENFSSFRQIRDTLRKCGIRLVEERGLHLFPFQLPLHSLSRWCDENLQGLRGLMINICILGQKETRPS
jgi:2-polyprenyl-3-methyl-5-hydroxy-6-metoxy-1,4-benzoquinol methylase